MIFDHKVFIEEQGLRDGLQTFHVPVPAFKRMEWIKTLVDAGVKRLQIGSFVNPKLVPMMAETKELFSLIENKSFDGITFSALALNTKGVQLAIETGVKHLSISLSASNTHSWKNTGKNIEASKRELKEMIELAHNNGISVRGGIQCAFGCRYEGNIDPKAVLGLSDFILEQGVNEIALADSTGMGNPLQIEDMINNLKDIIDDQMVGLHLHNTENKGYANIYAGLRAGVNIFDTTFGGLGGCPFIKGATGNVATEDTVLLLEQLGINTGIDLKKVAIVSKDIESIGGEELPGLMYKLKKKF